MRDSVDALSPDATTALYRREAEAAPHPRRAARLYGELGRLYEAETDGETSAAERAFLDALNADPEDLGALRGLRRLSDRSADWPRLATLLEHEIRLTTAPSDRAGLRLRLGTLLMERLEAPDRARREFALAAQDDPEDDEILLRLELVTADDDLDARLELLDRRLHLAESPGARGALLREMSTVLAQDPDTEDEALDRLREALVAAPGDRDTMLAFIRLHLQLGRVAELATALTQLSGEIDDSAFRGRLLYLAARLGLSRSEHPERAAVLLGQVALLLSDEPAFAHPLVADYESLGMWGAANALLDKLAANEPDETAAAWLYRAALNAEIGLRNDAQALDHLRRAVSRSPNFQAAWFGLRRVCWRVGDLPGWLEALDATTVVVADPSVRAAWFGLAARAREVLGGDADGALGGWRQAFAAASQVAGPKDDHDALAHLLRHLTARGLDEERLEVLETWLAGELSPETRRHALANKAELHEVQLEQPRAAARALTQLLELAPNDVSALRAVQRLSAASGDLQGLIGAAERELALVEEPAQRLALLARNAELHEELGDPRRAEDCWRRALAVSPRFLPALSGLGRLLYHHGRWHDLAALHRHELASLEQDSAERVGVLGRLAELYEFRLDQPDEAAAAYESLLALRPRAPDALAALERLYSARDRWADLGRVLSARVEHTEDPRERATLLARLGELELDHLDDRESALDHLESALSLAPNLVSLPWFLERLLSGFVDREREVMVLRALLTRTPLGGARLMLAHKLASALSPTEARSVYEELALSTPDDFVAHWSLYREAMERGDRRRACEDLTRLAQVVGDRRDACVLWREAAELGDAAALETQSRIALWQRVLELEPDDAAAQSALHRLWRRSGDSAAWMGWLVTYAESATDDRAVAVSRWLAGLEADAQGGGNPEQLWRDAAAACGDDPVPVWLLLDGAERAGQTTAATALRIELASRRGSGAAAAAALTEAGAALAEEGDAHRALTCWFEAVRRDPDAEEAAARLEALYAEAGQYLDWAALIARRLRRIGDDERSLPLLRRLLDLQQGPLDDQAGALRTLNRLLHSAPEDREARGRAVDVLARLGEFGRAAEEVEALLEGAGTDAEQATLLTRLGQLRARSQSGLDGAVDALRRAIGLMDPDGRAHEELAAVHLVRGEPGPALLAYERLERLVGEPERVAVAQAGQVRALIALGRLPEARARLDAFQTARPGDPVWSTLEEHLAHVAPPAVPNPGPAAPSRLEVAETGPLPNPLLETSVDAPPVPIQGLWPEPAASDEPDASLDAVDAFADSEDLDLTAALLLPPTMEAPPQEAERPFAQLGDTSSGPLESTAGSGIRQTVPYGFPAVPLPPDRAPSNPPAPARPRGEAPAQETEMGRPVGRFSPPPGADRDHTSVIRGARGRIEAEPLDLAAWLDLSRGMSAQGSTPGALWVGDVAAWLKGEVQLGQPGLRSTALPEELKRGLLPATVPLAMVQLLRSTGPWVSPPFCSDAGRHGVTAQDLVAEGDPLTAMTRRQCDLLGLDPVLLLRNPSRPYTTAVEAGDPSSVILGSAILDGTADTSRSFLLARCLVPLAEGTLLARKLTDREFGAFLAALLGLLGADLPVRARDRATYDRMRAQLEPALPAHRRTPALVELARASAVQMQLLAPAALRAGLETYALRLAFVLGDGAGGAFEMVRRLDFDDRPRGALSRADLVQFVTDSDVARDLLLFASTPQAEAIRRWLATDD
jgi:tetratricopeptide (TPR) repeat protein